MEPSLAQLRKAFGEIFRVLQPGGVFLFTYHIGEEVIHLDEFLGKVVDVDFMYFKTDFIFFTFYWTFQGFICCREYAVVVKIRTQNPFTAT